MENNDIPMENTICRCVFPEICPNCRHLPSTQVYILRNALKNNPDVIIKFHCFNKLEVDAIKKLLKPEELKRIIFTWWIFKIFNKEGVMECDDKNLNCPCILAGDADVPTIEAHGIVASLRAGKNVKVKFVKKDGSDRIMDCTLDFNKIPVEHYPKSTTAAKTEVEREELPLNLRVYDLEKRGWRSIPLFNLEWVNIDGVEHAVEYAEAT